MIELLSPAGDFDCLKAAVQNGADSVYFGGELFNARASAANFNRDNLRDAIHYAKLRNVKINFTLNTLIKNNEFKEAIDLANFVYSCGADALIVQDLGLARFLIRHFPNMDIHASTQMTIHNLHGVLELEKLGFKRIVLSRELSLNDIRYICANSNIEIETFIHGALCISYSGQCLFSSSIGARSGNRGKCAQPCRLPYELISENNNFSNFTNTSRSSNSTFDINTRTYKKIDKGYLLSPRDLCGLEYIPDLINAGVKCFKIEGRMKKPEYVATVTRIYRKYIDLALSNSSYIIDKDDITDLMQAFNRGSFSNGNYSSSPNTNYVFKEKPNNTGLYIGNVSNFDSYKGLVSFTTNERLSIGDKVSTEREEHKYTVSELIKNNHNVQSVSSGDKITVGRIKGNIKLGDKIYKISDTNSSKMILENINKENKKIPLSAHISIKKGLPISLEVTSCDSENGTFFSMSSTRESDVVPISAISNPITIDRIKQQLNKTTDTPFEFRNINVDLDDGCYVPKISSINQLRRDCLNDLINQAISRFERNSIDINSILNNSDCSAFDLNSNSFSLDGNTFDFNSASFSSDDKTFGLNSTSFSSDDDSLDSKVNTNIIKNTCPKLNLQLNEINSTFDYSQLNKVENIYIPIKYFLIKDYHSILKTLSKKGNLYICTPTILKDNYRNIIFNEFDTFINEFNIKGIVISNTSYIDFLQKYFNNLDIVANYNFNIFNNCTIDELSSENIDRVTLSPELDKKSLQSLSKNSSLPVELMVYGNLPLMNTGYCLLGCSNKCYPNCDMKCKLSSKFYLKDRLGFNFRIIPDNMQTITTIYNSKTTSIEYSDIKPQFVRVSVLDENIDEINNIIDHVLKDIPFKGEKYTKGNIDKNV